MVGTLEGCFCLPLALRIHQGFRHLGQAEPVSDPDPSLPERLVQIALQFTLGQDAPAFLVLDAFFSMASVFRLARSVYSMALRQPYLVILTRAKKNFVAYFPVAPKPADRPGPQPRYGEKVHLMEVFDHPQGFDEMACCVYGQRERVRLMSVPLLWEPLGESLLFIFAITSRGPLALMCSDLTLSPVTALELYCVRTRIEILFAVLKQLLGAFCFHFWTPHGPRHARRPTPNRSLKAPMMERQPTVAACWQAYEVFVFCAGVAQGLLQRIALRFGPEVWQQPHLYLRTRSRDLPSEKTVRHVLATRVLQQFLDLPPNSLIAQIRSLFHGNQKKEPADLPSIV